MYMCVSVCECKGSTGAVLGFLKVVTVTGEGIYYFIK